MKQTLTIVGELADDLYGSTEYNSWAMMKQRCYNQKNTNYSHYGGRGVTVYKPWHNFKTFIEYMGRKPTPKHTIDRIDNTEGYMPGNVRWATRLEQVLNRGMNKNNTSGHKGVSKVGKRWRAYSMENHRQINLGRFDTIEDAIAARKAYDRDHGYTSTSTSNDQIR